MTNRIQHAARRLVIVEDEILVALEIEEAASEAGFDVVGIAADCREALSLAPNADLALVDLNLRDGFTGPDIAREMMARYGIGVIFLTANPGLILGENIPALDVLAKPCRPDAIVAALTQGADALGKNRFTTQKNQTRQASAIG